MTATVFIWDFDGTLLDTRLRNYNVVRTLLADLGLAPDRMPALRSHEVYDRVNRRYVNWRDLYRREFGFSETETDRIGALWSEYQGRDHTPAEPFDGIAEALTALAAIPHGIVSQNASTHIRHALTGAGLAAFFRAIVGYDSVHIQRQKPEPDGLLACLDDLAVGGSGRVVYIGDHETDVRLARNAARALAARGPGWEVVSVAACFVDPEDHVGWSLRADYAATTPRDLIDVARDLGLDV